MYNKVPYFYIFRSNQHLNTRGAVTCLLDKGAIAPDVILINSYLILTSPLQYMLYMLTKTTANGNITHKYNLAPINN